MALIVCPECKKEISDSARSCPACGYRIKKSYNPLIYIICGIIVAACISWLLFLF